MNMSVKTLELNLELRDWQRDCMQHQTRFTVLACHRRSGKSHLAVYELAAAALQKKGNYAYVSPQKNQSKTNVWDVFKSILSNFIGEKASDGTDLVYFKESDITIRFFNGSVIYFLGGEDPDKIRGAKLEGVIVDEVAQTPMELWTEVLRPALMDTKGWALFIGTPKGINLFSELFYRGQDPSFKPDWSSRRFTCYDTKVLSEDEIESYKKETNENTFNREMLCDFSASADDQLLNLEQVEAAMHNLNEIPQTKGLPLIMGVDVARMGADTSAVVFRQGMYVEHPITFEQGPLTVLARKIFDIYQERQPDYVVVDGTGVGGGLVDILNDMNVPVFDICFKERASEATYANKRTEMWFKLAEWIRRGGKLPNIVKLKQELCAPLYEVDEGGRKTLEPKKKMRERLGWSPDLADALALTFAHNFDSVPKRSLEDQLRYDYGINVRGYRVTPIDRFEDKLNRHDYYRQFR